MKSFVKIFIVVAAVCAAVSCKNSGKSLLPNVAGKAGEVLVVLEKGYWDTGLGNDVRDVLARPCEYLPQRNLCTRWSISLQALSQTCSNTIGTY